MPGCLHDFAQRLVDGGVEHAFGVAGSGASWDLIGALVARGVQYHPTGHEAAGAMMAGAACRASGRLSASLAIKGPGLVNMAAGVAYNHFENLPVVSIAEAYPRDVPAFRRHKRLDHGAALRGITKGMIAVDESPELWAPLLAAARSEVPGPIHVELGGSSDFRPAPPPPLGGGDCRPAVDRIASARRPVVIAGGLACRRPWGTQLERLRVPVFTTAAARGAVDEKRPFAGGVFTGDGRELSPENQLLARSDLVVALGLRNLEVVNPRKLPAPLVLLDEADAEFGAGFEAEMHLPRAAEVSFDTVLTALHTHCWGEDEVLDCTGRMRAALCDQGWLPARCFAQLDALDWDHVLVLDTGSFCTIGEHMWRAGGGRSVAGSSNGRFMGGSIPVAVGYAIASPRRPVFCFVGDGGMRMYPGEIKLAVERQLPIAVIFCCDGRYGSIASARREPSLPLAAVSFTQPSWARAVEGFGCTAVQVRSDSDFASAVAAWDRRSPCFIEAVFDPEAYLHMTRRLR